MSLYVHGSTAGDAIGIFRNSKSGRSAKSIVMGRYIAIYLLIMIMYLYEWFLPKSVHFIDLNKYWYKNN